MPGLNPLVQAFLDKTSAGSTGLAFPGGRAANRGLTALGERYNPNPQAPKPLGSVGSAITPDPVANPKSHGVGGQLGLPNGTGPAELRAYVTEVAKKYGWDQANINDWYTLIQHESSWNPNAQNPHSTAYGLGQFLDSTWGGTGIAKTSNAQQQIDAMAKYIQARYQNPSGAWNFWQNIAPTKWGSNGY